SVHFQLVTPSSWGSWRNKGCLSQQHCSRLCALVLWCIPAVGQPLWLTIPSLLGALSSAWLTWSQQAELHRARYGGAGDSIALCALQPIMSSGL
uniref:Uncharacterized protein n=1 Tax=Strix occidentalis caurina TaxID=311401 RepID=A0A8D0FWZ2_STROC